jgi:uncharacterized DUF497 family protein
MLRFEWDENKNESNWRKHRVSFETAVLVFEDDHRYVYIERAESGEARWHAIGSIRGTYQFLTVVHTHRMEEGDEIIRIISARRATPRERRMYAEAIL